MWRLDNRLLVSPSKSHKIPENICYFKTRVNTVNTYTPQISSTDCKFYEYNIVPQVYDASCPKIAFFRGFD